MELNSPAAISAAHDRLTISSATHEAPDGLALVTPERAFTFAELAIEVAPRVRGLVVAAVAVRRPLVFEPLGSDAESVLRVLTCFEARVPFAGVHPRWTHEERAARLASLEGATPIPTGGRASRDGGGALTSAAEPEAPAAVLFTSGTSGAPRGVVLSRRAFAACGVVSRAAIPLGVGDRWLLSMPLAHVGGASILARCLVARAAVVLDDEGPFDAARWLGRVHASAATHASVVPTMLKRLVDHGERAPATLRHLVVGGAACDPSLALRARALGYPVQRSWGMTETCAMIATESVAGEGGVGHALEGIVIRARDSVLSVLTPTLASGVWTADGVAELPRDADGFFETGDVGTVATSGLVDVSGRRDDVIVTGGENVHPAEVEAALLAIAGIAAAAVFGRPDAEWGQRVVAAIVLDPSSRGLDDATLDAAMRARLAAFKRPRAWIRVESAPLLASGKVDRRALIARAQGRSIKLHPS